MPRLMYPIFVITSLISLSIVAVHAGEARASIWERIVVVGDRNGDGLLSPPEIRYFPATQRFPGFQNFAMRNLQTLDLNGDKQLSAQELQGSAQRLQRDESSVIDQMYRGWMARPSGQRFPEN